jgi:hypothetical protein
MNRAIILLGIFIAASSQAQIIDRILAVVDNYIITSSDLRREHEVRAVLGEDPARDERALLKALIDAHIIEDQASEYFGDIDATETDVDEVMKGITELRGLHPSVVRSSIQKRLRNREFVELRFRQFIRATDAEIKEYYETVFVPAAKSKGANPIPPLDQITDLIRHNVVEEKVARDLETWIDAIRRRSDIEIFD